MKFENASTDLRKQVRGDHERLVKGASVPMKGLLEIVQKHVTDAEDRDTAMLEIGFILGTASMLSGLVDRREP